MKTSKPFFSSLQNVVILIVCIVIVLGAIGGGIALAMGSDRSGTAMDRNTAFGYALADAGLTEQEVTVTKQKLDKDGGSGHYDIEFFSASYSYSYEIDAFSGAVLDVSVEALFDKPAAPSAVAAGKGQEAGQPGENQGNQQGSGQPGEDQGNQQGAGQSGEDQGNRQGSGQSGQGQGDQQGAGQSGQNSAQPSQGQDLLDLETAKALALSDAGVNAADAVFTKSKSDWEDGVQVYDIEFYTSNGEYEYEISAATGAVLEMNMELFEN